MAIRLFCGLLFLTLSAVAASAPALAANCSKAAIADWAGGQGSCLAIKTYGAAEAGPNPILFVMLHGDVSQGGPATYHMPFVESVAKPGAVAVAMVRPGYSDGDGRTSDGDLRGRRDHYTERNVNIVIGAVDALKAHYQPKAVILLGHSGGAATAGVAIGKKPGIADIAMLVSCPCDIDYWRRARGRGPWRTSLSPDDFIETVPKDLFVYAIVGSRDSNTFPDLSEDYISDLIDDGGKGKAVVLPGLGHGFYDIAKHAAFQSALAEALEMAASR